MEKIKNFFNKFFHKTAKVKTMSKVENCTTFINMPIYSDEEDKIGIEQHTLEIKDAINKGAQTIAITSDFGGGKSSLVKYLETQYSNITTKFCYVNLWCDINNDDSTELHRSFIYQLGSQISKRKGKYISKRLSKNYGLIKICLQSTFQSILSYIMFVLMALGALCIPLYDNITSKIITYEFIKQNHNNIGIVVFIAALFIGVFLLYSADIVFSSKQSAGARVINEHELMDIYKSYICKHHFKHYIVIIEDLDRTKSDKVIKFIRELRRYYVPTDRKQYKNKCIRNISNYLDNKLHLKNRNRITFIVNIKTEASLGNEAKDLYPKVFDYTLNLKQIHIDNYDVIMRKLLEDNKELFKRNNIPVFKDNVIIPEFEWLKRGRDLNIRELKNRLNAAISTYINLLHKFESNKVSMPKCIASAYINVAFEKEYSKIEEIGFDGIINLYVKDHQTSSDDVIKYFSSYGVEITDYYASELIRLIKANLLDFDYKQYFYNFPKDSYLHTNKENQLINIILYDADVSEMSDFDVLANNIIKTNSTVIDDSYKRLDDLGLLCPKCIFYSFSLMDYSLNKYPNMVWGTLSKELPYDDESMTRTSKILIDVIKNNLSNNQSSIEKICNIVIENTTPQGIITFRREIINQCYDNIEEYAILYSNETPLITKNEINKLKGKPELLSFINLESADFTIEFVESIQPILLEYYSNNADAILKVIVFYCSVYEILGETENNKLTNFMFEYMMKTQILFSELEKIVLVNNEFSEIENKYVNIINAFSKNNNISYYTIDALDENDVVNGLSENVCNQLYAANHMAAYIANACSTNIDIINFSDHIIIDCINNIDFYDEDDKKFSEEILLQIRNHILNQSIDLAKYYTKLFFDGNIVISKNELDIIDDKETALLFIDKNQIDTSNIEYIAAYFNNGISSQNLTFSILMFVTSIDNSNAKRTLFDKLDFDNIQYYRISYARRNTIREQISDAYDFSKVKEQIEYMKITKTSHSEFEKQIKALIIGKKFIDFEELYAEYTWNLKKVTDIVVSNLCSMNYIQLVPPIVYNKMYEQGRYWYYVIAKIKNEQRFIFEYNKINNLYSTYIKIYFADNVSNEIKEYMSDNSQFVEYILSKKEYEGLSSKERLQFTNALQNKDSLYDLYTNYPEKTVVDYLSLIKGFKDYEAAEYYVSLMHNNKNLGKSHALYSHNYEHLVDSKLKRLYTRYYNH